MIDLNKEVVSALKPILPTYYEFFADGTVEKPCITYAGYGNYDKAWGDTLGWSDVQYMVKIWTDKVIDMQSYSEQVDTAMRGLGFHRISSQELSVDNQLCKMLVYGGLGYETY